MGITSGVGGLLGSKKERKAYKRAQRTMERLVAEGKAVAKEIDPWGEYRADYAKQLNEILSGERDFQTDPGYQFRVAEGERATERAAASRGGRMSGGVLAELQERGQGVASQEYGNIIGRLMELSGAYASQAVAAGQVRAGMTTQGLTGVAEAQIGQGFAKSRGIASHFSGVEATNYTLWSRFDPGMSGAQQTGSGASTGMSGGGGMGGGMMGG